MMRKKCRKHIIVTALVTTISTFVPTYTYSLNREVPAIESPSDWAVEEINKAQEKGIIPDRVIGKYKKNITREEFAELVVNLYEALSGIEGVVDSVSLFKDTDNPKVSFANTLGIVKGVGEGLFAPDKNATREEVSVMLYRTLRLAKPEINTLTGNKYYFSDENDISSWSMEAINFLYEKGVINGVGGNKINPKGLTSVEEAIVLANRLYEIFSRDEVSINQIVSRGMESRKLMALESLIYQELGKPYRWGGIGPDGYDCSGLVYALYKKLGIYLPRSSSEQAKVGTYVAKEDLRFGDLVFFARNGRTINHVGIYMGNGEFVHSPQSGDVVKITTLESGYYQRSYYTARRIIY